MNSVASRYKLRTRRNTAHLQVERDEICIGNMRNHLQQVLVKLRLSDIHLGWCEIKSACCMQDNVVLFGEGVAREVYLDLIIPRTASDACRTFGDNNGGL